jgi:flagellar biosynthesis/type III secretory pathway M-ring protein FliF/YscJ
MPTNENAKILSQLRDIKDIVIIEDNSLYQLMSIFGAILLLLIIIFLIYKKMTKITKTKQPTQLELAKKRLKELDLDDDRVDNTKHIAYTFSIDGALFLNDENKIQFEQINNILEKYKYKKTIEPMSDEIKSQIKEFINGAVK